MDDAEDVVASRLRSIGVCDEVVAKLLEQRLAKWPHLSDMTPKSIADVLGVPVGDVMPSNFVRPIEQLLRTVNLPSSSLSTDNRAIFARERYDVRLSAGTTTIFLSQVSDGRSLAALCRYIFIF